MFRRGRAGALCRPSARRDSGRHRERRAAHDDRHPADDRRPHRRQPAPRRDRLLPGRRAAHRRPRSLGRVRRAGRCRPRTGLRLLVCRQRIAGGAVRRLEALLPAHVAVDGGADGRHGRQTGDVPAARGRAVSLRPRRRSAGAARRRRGPSRRGRAARDDRGGGAGGARRFVDEAHRSGRAPRRSRACRRPREPAGGRSGFDRAGQPAQHRLHHHRRSGLWRHRRPRQPGGEDAAPRSPARSERAAHGVSREPHVFADTRGAHDRPARVPLRCDAHDPRAGAAGAFGHDAATAPQGGRLHDRHLRQVASRRRGRLPAGSPRVRSHLHPRGRRHRPDVSGQLRRRARQHLLQSLHPQRRHVREDARLLHRRLLQGGDRMDGRLSQGGHALLLLHSHQCSAWALRLPAGQRRGPAREARGGGIADGATAAARAGGGLLRHDRKHRRQRRPAPPAARRLGHRRKHPRRLHDRQRLGGRPRRVQRRHEGGEGLAVPWRHPRAVPVEVAGHAAGGRGRAGCHGAHRRAADAL